MIKGIGLDVIEIDRIKTLLNRKQKFAERILTKEELDVFNKLDFKRKPEFLAGRFAAKEALSKALGCGIGEEFSFQDASVLANNRGKPSVHFVNPIPGNIHISITHTTGVAVAQVIWEDES
ncbi:holo-ACP synthase [Alteribacter populi]|uniref:holo-ACP synthase n=1 Tax=Alteribacter populi TaxID=2011011 RepID=UPI000BBAD0C9|nr:holo-ACP synthase [Alteribacter populi]